MLHTSFTFHWILNDWQKLSVGRGIYSSVISTVTPPKPLSQYHHPKLVVGSTLLNVEKGLVPVSGNAFQIRSEPAFRVGVFPQHKMHHDVFMFITSPAAGCRLYGFNMTSGQVVNLQVCAYFNIHLLKVMKNALFLWIGSKKKCFSIALGHTLVVLEMH